MKTTIRPHAVNTSPLARVQSIGRAFSILEAISASTEGIGLAELSKQVGLHNSTAFHLVKTMLDLGYARQDPETKRYFIGHKLFGLAAGANNEANLVFVAGPILQDLTRLSGETCHIAVFAGDEVMTIAKSEGPATIRMTERLGAARPAYCTAIGKALLASLSQGQLDDYLKRVEMRSFTPKTIVDPARLRREVEGIRQAGVAIDDAEFNVEARCIAAPVFDFTGRIVAAIGISGPAWRITPDSTFRLGKIVSDCAFRLSSELGHHLRANGLAAFSSNKSVK
ncbi:MAG TPA: IclR family transcriptional regulator [Burkholderiales bacterium]|nr:IclR family transcriptional regulator [Burkholderiales bacterium]